jgi:uncharacterized protein
VPGVSDSSPLSYLSSLLDLDLLRRIIGDIVIPHAVYREVVVDGHGQPGAEEVQRATDNWISVVDANDSSEVTRMMQVVGLHEGESEAKLVRPPTVHTKLKTEQLVSNKLCRWKWFCPHN